jgi:hypothetical protein
MSANFGLTPPINNHNLPVTGIKHEYPGTLSIDDAARSGAYAVGAARPRLFSDRLDLSKWVLDRLVHIYLDYPHVDNY